MLPGMGDKLNIGLNAPKGHLIYKPPVGEMCYYVVIFIPKCVWEDFGNLSMPNYFHPGKNDV